MQFDWDDNKNARNVRERGIDFGIIGGFDWTTALVIQDERQNYGEMRLRAYGTIAGRLYVCVYTERGEMRRIISLRKANKREKNRYEKIQKT